MRTNGATNAGSASTTAVTGVVGGGLEYAFDNHWSLKGEYLYVPLKSQASRRFRPPIGLQSSITRA